MNSQERMREKEDLAKGVEMSRVKFLSEVKQPNVSKLGGKGCSLAILTKNGFNVPKGFVIVSTVFFEYLEANNLISKIERLSSEIDESNFQQKSREIKDLILNGKIPKEIASEIEESLGKLDVEFVSIRSSAVSEDSLKASFAGLFDTFLNVRVELLLVLKNVKKCWASLFNERTVAYRTRKGIPHLEGIAVIIQEMIPSEISGITFTVHPIDKKSLLIEASYGIGDMIVSGKVDPDNYIIDRETLQIKERKIGNKKKMSISSDAEIKIIDVKDEVKEMQVLSEEEIKRIAKTCLELEKIFNYPQDIEWCISNNELWLLQSRAITGKIK